ncbi:hypothetical protein [Cellulophaga sp. Z1A5H]|uniref:hypothetical protein n=1 Tax=Cellulophaga sp. Z1A5H TaxID=2687291 RepID=UPI0013FD467C|nr:hypothetical protein [Cellulophaga sp. Z1A5H]
MEKTNYYKAFVAQTQEEILQAVFEKDENIIIAISLHNGAYLEGILLDITEDDSAQKSICLLSNDEQVSFFSLHSVTLITIKQPKKMLVELSKGTISRPLSSENKELTVLQLKRWLNTEKSLLGNQIKEINLDATTFDTLNNRLNIQDIFAALKNAIDQLTKDTLGQEAWKNIETINLQQAETLQLSIHAETLSIALAIDKALPKNLSNILEEKLLQQL